jgi:hypothetical protein
VPQKSKHVWRDLTQTLSPSHVIYIPFNRARGILNVVVSSVDVSIVVFKIKLFCAAMYDLHRRLTVNCQHLQHRLHRLKCFTADIWHTLANSYSNGSQLNSLLCHVIKICLAVPISSYSNFACFVLINGPITIVWLCIMLHTNCWEVTSVLWPHNDLI